MNGYKICVYAIYKNEEKFAARWMDAVCEADEVIVLDTGSTDKTRDILEEKGARVFAQTIDPWRFDTARNIAMSHIPEDTDICVSSDLDEVFRPGWREKLEQAWDSSYTRARYTFVWSYNEDGTPAKQYSMEKIHRRSGFEWVRPVHEILKYTGQGEDKSVFVDIVLDHYPDLNKSRKQYLPLLELAAEEAPQDDRVMFWLGREYMYRSMYDQAIKTLLRHLSLPSAVWDEERSASMRYIAACHMLKGNFGEAKRWLYRAIAECPRIREPYLDIVKLGYTEKDWPLVYAMGKKGLSITSCSGSYLIEPESWGYALYDYASIGAANLGLWGEALTLSEEARKLGQNNERLLKNYELIKQISGVVIGNV